MSPEPVSDRIFDSNELTIGHDATYASVAILVHDYSNFIATGKLFSIDQGDTLYGTGLTTAASPGKDKIVPSTWSSNSDCAAAIVNAINNADNSFKNVCRATLAGTGSFENQVVVITSFMPGIKGNSQFVSTTSAAQWAKIISGPDAGRFLGIGTPTVPGATPTDPTPQVYLRGATGNSPSWVDNPLTSSADGGQWYSQWSLERFIKPLTYVTDHTSSLNPYRDRPGQEELFRDIRDPGIRSYLEGNSGAMTLGGRPSLDSESAGKGFTFDNTEFGIDSIAFGGRKK